MPTTLTHPTALLENASAMFDTMDVSDKTREDYKNSVKPFLEFVSTRTMNNNTFLEFKRELKERTDIGVSTKNKYLIAARILLKEMARLGMIPVDITMNVKGFKQNKGHKKDGLSAEEVAKVCAMTDGLDVSFQSLRLKAIFALLIFQGLRQKELIGMNVSDVNLELGTAKIIGKGRDDYETIYLHPNVVLVLREFMLTQGIRDGAIFFNQKDGVRLSTRHLRRMVTVELGKLGIAKSTHGFRHYNITALCEAFGGDLLKVIKFSRHKSIDMVQVYSDEKMTHKSLGTFYGAFGGVKIGK